MVYYGKPNVAYSIRLILYVFFYYVFNCAFNIQLIFNIQRVIQYSAFGVGLRVLSSCCTVHYHITRSLNEAPSIYQVVMCMRILLKNWFEIQ